MTDVQEARQPIPRDRGRTGLGFLLASTGVAITGQGMVSAAAPLLAASLTRDPFAVSAVTAASYAAWLIIGLPAGALVDRWPRKLVLVLTDALRTGLLALLAVLVLMDAISVPLVVLIVFLIGVGSCFFDPASQATLPILVGRDRKRLTSANGKLWALDTFGRSLAGPPLGAAAFGLAPFLPFGVDAVAFLLSAVLLLGIPKISRTDSEQQSVRLESLRASIVNGLKFVGRTRQLLYLAAGMGAYNFGYNIAFAPLVLFAQDRLDVTDFGFGVLIATMALGGVLGGFVAPRFSRYMTALSIYSVCLLGQALGWFFVLFVGNPWLAGVGLAFVGFASTTVSVVGGAARQLLTPDDLMGRMTSVTRMIGIGAAALGSLVGGGVAAVWGIGAPMMVAAGLLLAFALVFAVARRTIDNPVTSG